MTQRKAPSAMVAPVLLVLGTVLQSEAQTVTRQPYLQLATPTSIVVKWRTDSPSESVVFYGPEPGNLACTAESSGLTTDHEVSVAGLDPSRRYYYGVGTSLGVLAGGDRTFTFKTPPPAGSPKPTRVWVTGDEGSANSGARAVRDSYQAFTGSRGTDLWLMLGDNAYPEGKDTDYRVAVFDMFPVLLRQTPLWPTLGNHDPHSASSAAQGGPYYEIFALPTRAEAGGYPSGTEAYYSFDYGNIHFICLDSTGTDGSPDGAGMTWLKTDLASTEQEWVVAFWHHPPYSAGTHDSDVDWRCVRMREDVVPILEDYGVDLILTGHSHNYERSFLLDGHYGTSDTLTADMVLDGGDGREEGDGVYTKSGGRRGPHEGAVYLVAGSSGRLDATAPPLDHPAMFFSLNRLGSVVLDVFAQRLDATFLDSDGNVRDAFTIVKGPDKVPPAIVKAETLDATTVSVEFAERLEATSAETVGNYLLDNGAAVAKAVLQSDGKTVILSTTPLGAGVTRTINVNNVKDLAGNPVPPDTQAQFEFTLVVTKGFQDGAAPFPGYVGTRDTCINEASPTVNVGNDTALQLDGDDGAGMDRAILIGWDLSEIPVGAVIEAATITMDVLDPSSQSYEIYEVRRDWQEGKATWNEYNAGGAWELPGARGSSDRGAPVLGVVSADTTGSYSLRLNGVGVAVIQSWVDGIVPNRGFVLADASASDGLEAGSREAANAAGRPRLDVTYLVSAGDAELPAAPQDLTVAGTTASTVSLGWKASTDNTGVSHYRVYRDGAQLSTVRGTGFTDGGLNPGSSYTYVVTGVDRAGNESAASSEVTASTRDTQPPTITIVEAIESTRVLVEFDEPLDLASAETAGNYTLDQGVDVISVALQSDARTVLLTTSSMVSRVTHTLTVDDVEDLDGNPVSSDTHERFVCAPRVDISFQDGGAPDAGYAGTRDTYVSKSDPTTNFGTGSVLRVDGDDDGDGDLGAMIAWDLSDLPVGAVIEAATITIDVLNPSRNGYELYELKRDWQEVEATWERYGPGSPWEIPGALGIGDRGMEVLGVVRAGSSGSYTLQLNADGLAVIQAWVEGLLPNRGFILTDSGAGDGLSFSSREALNATARPRLDITYSMRAIDSEPPTAPIGRR